MRSPIIEMSYPRHLTRAPITEAVLDVAVERVPDDRADHFSEFAAAAQAEFPDVRPIPQFQAAVAMNAMEASVHSSAPEQLGCICWNRDKTRAVQVRLNGFSVNHVKSYKTWEELLTRSRTWWPHYLRLFSPATVVRCGVRFINQIEVSPGTDLGTFLRTRPELAPGLPQELEEYFQRLVIPFADGVRAGITQVIAGEAQSNTRGLVLDIDVSMPVCLDANTEDLWPIFERLREVKNQCFFESLQPTKWEDFQ